MAAGHRLARLDAPSSSLYTRRDVSLLLLSVSLSLTCGERQGNSSCLPESNVYRSAPFIASLPTSWTFCNKWVPFISGIVVNKISPISLHTDKPNQARDRSCIHLYFILASFCAFDCLVLSWSLRCGVCFGEMMPTLFQIVNHLSQK